MNALSLNRTLQYSSLLAAAIYFLPGISSTAFAQSFPGTPLQPEHPAFRELAEATSPFSPALRKVDLETSFREAELGSSESSSLPDAPEPNALESHDPASFDNLPEPRSSAHVASLYTKDISAGWQAQALRPRDKVVLGLRDLYSFGNFGSMFVASGFSHLTNGQPNFGTDRGAYGQRLGAAALRETSEGVLTDSVFAPILHEDPRFYVLGPQYGLLHRTLYAITRPLITRSDSGRSTINGALLLGNGTASVLTNAYYPASNRNVHDTLATFGGSIGGAALGFVVSEFADQLLVAVHLRRPE